MIDKKKLTFSLILALSIALFFWSQSRFPQLNEKAQMGQRNNVSAIAFDPVYNVDPAEPYLLRVAKTAANWGHTNWKGMAFGLAFAAAFLTFLRLLPPGKPGRNSFINSIKGLFTGIPLGVCVNCTTPIAYGMHQAGVNLHTVLATLMSSPTLNIVVLTMAFALLPLHLAIIKVVSALLFILLGIPFMLYIAGRLGWLDPVSSASLSALESSAGNAPFSFPGSDSQQCEIPMISTSWREAFSAVTRDYVRHLVFILKMTLPLMLAAGVLGALLFEAFAFDQLYRLEAGFLVVLLVALVGTFLPVPIAFDIIIVTSLLATGLVTGLSMTLLFSLSIFSIYPALVIARYISVKISLLIFVSTVLCAMLVGASSAYLDDRINAADALSISSGLQESSHIRMLNIALQQCSRLDPDRHAMDCMDTFLKSELALSFDAGLCDRLDSADNSMVEQCRSSINAGKVLKQALDSDDIEHCLTLTPAESQGRCWMAFAEQRALDPAAIEYCDTFQNKAGVQECQAKILLYRAARMHNPEACNINLLPAVRQDCLNHVESMIRSLGGDLSSCDQLNNATLVHNCRKNIFLLEIDDEHNYAICEQFPGGELKQQCVNYALFDQAETNADPGLCDGVENDQFRFRCITSATVKVIEQRIFKESMYSLETGGASFPDKDLDNNRAAGKRRQLSAPVVVWSLLLRTESVEIKYSELRHARNPGGGVFVKTPGDQLGVDNPVDSDLHDLFEPLSYGGGIASGDFNNDFWPDIVFSSDSGIHLYRNNGDGTFQKTSPIVPKDVPFYSVVVAFVDINNDGWQDLFASTFGGDNYFLMNRQGQFDFDNKIILADNNRILTMATGFADWNLNGYLDFVLGNWSYGTHGAFNPEYSHNEWVTNEGMQFTHTMAPELEGDTLSVLLSDLNQDNLVDMMIANDREYPDHYYLGGGASGFTSVDTSSRIPVTSLNNMSIDTADFNNDLLPDLFSTDMSFSMGVDRTYCDLLTMPREARQCRRLLQGYSAIQRFDVSWCRQQVTVRDQQICLSSLAVQIANRDGKPEYCDEIPTPFHAARRLCQNLAGRSHSKAMVDHKTHIRQKQQNVLLIQNSAGQFEDQSEAMGVSESYWSWTGKAADLDNDEWQDIYVGNGYEFGTKNNEIHSNVFFRNNAGKTFTREEKHYGLEDYVNTSSYSYSDFDLDGDIDIIATGVMSTPRFFINQGNSNKSISFDLRDATANRFCIGCKVMIYYAGDKHQMRELKLSGGFQSFDNPVVTFGLGPHTEIQKLEIIWSDGVTSTFDHSFPAQRRYLVTRESPENPVQ